MNYLCIDYGTKRIGLAISIQDIISPLKTISNDKNTFNQIKQVVDQHQIEKIFVGMPEWGTKPAVVAFVKKLSSMLELNIETVEESLSTIEAESIIKANKNKTSIDAVAAAVILKRALGQ